jgi:hypothetical protein
MFTKEQINEILELCEKSPLGPWKYEREEQSANAFGLNLVFETVVDANGVKILRSNDKWLAQFIALARTTFPQLAKEVIRLREKYEQPNPKCNKGHVNNLPLALWDCPICTEELKAENAKLRAVAEAAKGIEWVYGGDNLEGMWLLCPCCGKGEIDGHNDDCKLHQALVAAGYGGEE